VIQRLFDNHNHRKNNRLEDPIKWMKKLSLIRENMEDKSESVSGSSKTTQPYTLLRTRMDQKRQGKENPKTKDMADM